MDRYSKQLNNTVLNTFRILEYMDTGGIHIRCITFTWRVTTKKIIIILGTVLDMTNCTCGSNLQNNNILRSNLQKKKNL